MNDCSEQVVVEAGLEGGFDPIARSLLALTMKRDQLELRQQALDTTAKPDGGAGRADLERQRLAILTETAGVPVRTSLHLALKLDLLVSEVLNAPASVGERLPVGLQDYVVSLRADAYQLFD